MNAPIAKPDLLPSYVMPPSTIALAPEIGLPRARRRSNRVNDQPSGADARGVDQQAQQGDLLHRCAGHHRTITAVLLSLAFPAALLAAWVIVHATGVISERILPGPATVARTFIELLANGEIAAHLGVSLGRIVRGAALGVSIGLALGFALGLSRTIDAWIGPTFRIIVQIPSIALIPLLMAVLGIDDALKLFIMAKACVVPLALVTAAGIRDLPTPYLELGRVYRMRPFRLLRTIVIPGALPSIFTGIRQGLAHVWISLVAVEVLASAEGIGYLMTWGRLIFQLDVVLVCVALIGAIGLSLDLGLKQAERRLLRWRGTPA